MTAKPLLVLLSVFASPAVFGAQLVKDINTTAELVGSFAGNAVAPVDVASGKLLLMNDGAHGVELWITDGTVGGTRMVRDIWPGPDSSAIESFTLMSGIAYFWANDGVNGAELWRSDGTAAGTRIVVNIGAGSEGACGGGFPGRALTVAGGVLYFAARDGMGIELWRSNGTADGTYRVHDINAGTGDSQIAQIFVNGSRLFFGATDAQGFEPWTSDGTSAGTVRIADIRAGMEGSGAYFYAAAGGAVFFTANDGAHGIELWRVNADGTGANIVADINTTADGVATFGSKPQGVFAAGNSVVFTAVTGRDTAETNSLYSAGASGGATLLAAAPARSAPTNVLKIGTRAAFRLRNDVFITSDIWVTDGTAAGTAKPNIPQGVGFFNFDAVTAYGIGEAFFCVSGAFSGSDIWRTDGTVAGTRLYLAEQPGSSLYPWLAYYSGRVYFPMSTRADTTGTEVWSTDGTTAGTRLLLDINPGQNDSFAYPIGAIGGRMVFFANDGASGSEPWSTDGTAGGTSRLGNFAPEITTRSSNPVPIGAIGSDLLFSANDDVNGRELWASDGTAAGTRLVKDIYPGGSESHVTNAYPVGGAFLFGAEDPAAGLELWRTDGTTAGTWRVTDIYPGASPGLPLSYLSGALLNGNFYFIAQDAGNYRDLWRTDGTTAGTSMVADIGTGFDSVEIIGVVSSRVLILRRPSGSEDGVVWSTDGTPAGTFEVTNNVFVYSTQSVLFNGRRCFAARQTGTPEIFCSNGSQGDMVRVTDLAGIGAQAAGMPHAVNGILLVPGIFTGVGSSVFSTNGAPASTAVFSSGTMMNLPDVPFGGGIVYQRYDNGTAAFMYTDGTVAGTRPFLPAGTPAAATNIPVLFDGKLIFLVAEGQASPSIWRSDGTAAGTRYLTNIDPFATSGNWPSGFVRFAGKLFFAGTRAGIGNELWTLSSVDPNATDDVLRTANATAGVAPVLDNDADFDGTLNTSSVQIVTPPSSGTTSMDSATGAITYTPNAGFSGADSLSYRVADNDGRLSNLAYLSIVVASPAGSGPGTAPAPTPTPTPTPTPPSNPPKSGGGGALGVEVLLLALLVLPRRRGTRRNRVPR